MRVSMPLADWPEPDHEMWGMLLHQAGPLDDGGSFAHLSDPSLDMYAEAYGRWLAWLLKVEPDACFEAPAERVTMPRMRAWLEASSHLHVSSRFIFLRGLLRVVSAADPTREWGRLARLARHFEREAGRGDRSRKQGRILSSNVLLKAGIHHATLDAEEASTPVDRAICQRDGAMVAFLAAMPLRHRAFAGLRIGQSVLVSGGLVTVSLPEYLTKTGVPWEADLAASASQALLRYVQQGRPVLMARGGQDHDVLWVGNLGGPMGYSYIGKKVPEITRRLTGVKIPPHFFRDAAATTLARTSPRAAKVIGPVLAHAGARIAERHYIQAGSVQVGRDYSKLLNTLKGDS